MTRSHYAKLAAAPLLAVLLAMGEVNPPLTVHFQLTDGVQVNGQLASWDDEGFDGSFGRRLWTDLKVQDAWRLYQRVMDRNSPRQWVDLGKVMLLAASKDEKASDFAEQSFKRALRLDESSAALIEAARQEAASAERKRREADQKADAARLKTTSPEGDAWRADPWPSLTEAELAAAANVMRVDAEQMARKIGMDTVPIETARFLLYTDAPRASGARWVLQLEGLCDSLRQILARDTVASSPFWGKAVVFVFSEQDKYRVAEAELFNQLVPLASVAMCHPVGPKVFITAHMDVLNDNVFLWELFRATVHGVMHHHQTPKRLPAWANDGFAEHVSSKVLRDAKLGAERRAHALQYIRDGGAINPLLNLTYADQTWPGPNEIGRPLGELIVDLLLREKPRQFIEWVNAVKAGEEWEAALRDKLGISRASLVDTVTRYYRVNN